MDDALSVYAAFARNNAWANHRLHRAMAALDDAAFDAPRVNVFPSLRATAVHILEVDLLYLDALDGARSAALADDVDRGELRRRQRVTDDRLIAFCDRLTSEAAARAVDLDRRTWVQVERADRILLHLFQHQIHHRGQAHAMLADTRVAPPQLDEFFLAEEAPLRADDFQELGWRDDGVWP
ncbi:MAG: DinB family protein [Pseudomonadota bacterium]